MNKKQFNDLLKEKNNRISKLKNEIKELKIEYATNVTKFKKDDIVSYKNINGLEFRCIGIFEYSEYNESIIVDCEVIKTNDTNFEIGQIFSIHEQYLTKI